MPNVVVVGAQWGDEAKGKVVDYLAERAEMVVRYGGGSNAGHTVTTGGEVFKLHLVPSGILHQDVTCVISAGVVVDPAVLVEEIRELKGRGCPLRNLRISALAHVILPYHRVLDQLEERSRSKLAIGTTGRGIGPAYADKAARRGLRMGEFVDDARRPQALRARLEAAVIESILSVRDMLPGDARSFLARFLFTGDDVFQTVGTLSGGEKNRLMLAQLVLDRPNLLVLDEPTNHLDIAARDALARMLREYDGTLILASHDRYLLDETTTQTLKIADGRASVFDGSYSVAREARPAASPARARSPRAKATSASEARPLNSFELARARKKAAASVAAAEKQVTEVEDWLRRIEECLSYPSPGDDMVQLARDHARAQEALDVAMAEWEGAVRLAEDLGVPI